MWGRLLGMMQQSASDIIPCKLKEAVVVREGVCGAGCRA